MKGDIPMWENRHPTLQLYGTLWPISAHSLGFITVLRHIWDSMLLPLLFPLPPGKYFCQKALINPESATCTKQKTDRGADEDSEKPSREREYLILSDEEHNSMYNTKRICVCWVYRYKYITFGLSFKVWMPKREKKVRWCSVNGEKVWTSRRLWWGMGQTKSRLSRRRQFFRYSVKPKVNNRLFLAYMSVNWLT